MKTYTFYVECGSHIGVASCYGWNFFKIKAENMEDALLQLHKEVREKAPVRLPQKFKIVRFDVQKFACQAIDKDGKTIYEYTWKEEGVE